MISLKQLEEFSDNEVWKVFKAELQVMRTNVLEGLAREVDMMGVWRAQGRAEALADMIIWPEVQIEEALAIIKKTEKEKTNE